MYYASVSEKVDVKAWKRMKIGSFIKGGQGEPTFV